MLIATMFGPRWMGVPGGSDFRNLWKRATNFHCTGLISINIYIYIIIYIYIVYTLIFVHIFEFIYLYGHFSICLRNVI